MRKIFGLVLTMGLLVSGLAMAQIADVPAGGLIEQIFGFLKPMLEAAAGKYGVIVQVVAVIGAMRVVFKPIMAVVQSIVSVTPSPKDDEFLGKLMNHWSYKLVSFLLDWTASVKLPQKQ